MFFFLPSFLLSHCWSTRVRQVRKSLRLRHPRHEVFDEVGERPRGGSAVSSGELFLVLVWFGFGLGVFLFLVWFGFPSSNLEFWGAMVKVFVLADGLGINSRGFDFKKTPLFG